MGKNSELKSTISSPPDSTIYPCDEGILLIGTLCIKNLYNRGKRSLLNVFFMNKDNGIDKFNPIETINTDNGTMACTGIPPNGITGNIGTNRVMKIIAIESAPPHSFISPIAYATTHMMREIPTTPQNQYSVLKYNS